eukprot:CAMPEP_0177223722 /NCGR_PEP_ID=MMETSP0367-20130122/38634_1 /TAXON_ID=447022 ORGANISM="Scrippsiella hangoei-like, Strain SHHI-4" /NCGR_SAMPLE_ID=MMETSP0367 /ASSEMBLY_ACC=CAM_ASM_000362 /LENGTH=168 /DNA_ID=CAMNT_0018673707 /DNA_START=206 /DNA_END=709 /DNA_ORIENTATION=-
MAPPPLPANGGIDVWVCSLSAAVHPPSPRLEAILLPLVEQVGLSTAQVDDFRAAIPVLLALTALLAVVGVRDASTSADHAAPLVAAVVAFVADPRKGAGPDVRVADDALAIALLAETTDGDAGLLPAHDQVRMVLRHGGCTASPPRAAKGGRQPRTVAGGAPTARGLE